MENNKNFSKKLIMKSITWYTISNILLRSISIITAPIFTRLLTPADYGQVSNFSAWLSILGCITGLGLGTAVIRGKIEFEDEFNKFLSGIQSLGFIFTLLICVAIIPFLNSFSKIMEINKELIIIMMIYLLIFPSVGYLQTKYRFEYQYKKIIAISIINTLGNVICSIIFILILNEQRYYGRIIGTLLPTFIIGFYFFIKIFLKGKCLINIRYWKYGICLGVPLVIHGLSMIVLAQIDRVMIIKICGEIEAGIYSFGYNYAILISMLTNAINEAIQPNIYKKLDEKSYGGINKIAKTICIFMLIIGIEMILIAPEAFRILGTTEYSGGVSIVFPIVIGSIFQLMYQNYTCVEIYYKKTNLIAIGSVLSAILNIILNIIFIKKFGYIAAGYTTMVSYMILMIFHFIGARVVAKIKIFSLKEMLLLIVAGISLGYISNFSYYISNYIRYIFILVIFVGTVMISRKKLIEIKLSEKND